MEERKELMIAGKTHSEILSWGCTKRWRWYKKLLREGKQKEKEEAMRIVNIEMRIKISASKMDHIPSEETKAKLSKSLIEKWKDPEYRNKHTGKNNVMYGRTGENHHMYGRIGENNPNFGSTRTEEIRAKQSAIKIEHWKDPEYRAKFEGENNPSYIDGRKSDLQYEKRWYLKSLGLPNEFVELALLQKKKRTDIELIMEYWLLNNEVPYEFQKYIKLSSTSTKVDFFIDPNICLYCDGNRWHELEERRVSDERITKELESMGYRVIRIWGRDIHDGIRPLNLLEMPQLKYEQQLLEIRGEVL